jgi:hypothetical protein
MAKNNVRILAGTEIFLFVISTKVGIVIRLWAGRSRVQFPAEARDFPFSRMFRRDLRTQWAMELFPRGKAAEA